MKIKKIMLVDDSRVSRMMFIKFLEETPLSFEFVEAGSGEEALALLTNNEELKHFVVDYNMPGMNGLELIAKVKAIDPEAVFNLLTANIQPDMYVRCEKLGVSVTAKPITKEKVIDIIKEFQK